MCSRYYILKSGHSTDLACDRCMVLHSIRPLLYNDPLLYWWYRIILVVYCSADGFVLQLLFYISYRQKLMENTTLGNANPLGKNW